jgi:predicted dithiol-disulfide oxidoreductase (DUF899 family)
MSRSVATAPLKKVTCQSRSLRVEPGQAFEAGGHSCFLTDGDKIFHTYSTYARGSDQTIGAYALLDLTALGRHEDWEEPTGRVASPHPADPTFTS